MLFSPRSFFSLVSALFNKLKSLCKKAIRTSESTFEGFLSTQVLREKLSSLSSRRMIISAVSLLSHDPPDKSESFTTSGKGPSQRLAGVVSRTFLAQQQIWTLKNRKNWSSSPMTLADSHRLKKRGSAKSVRADLGLPFASSPRKLSRKGAARRVPGGLQPPLRLDVRTTYGL